MFRVILVGERHIYAFAGNIATSIIHWKKMFILHNMSPASSNVATPISTFTTPQQECRRHQSNQNTGYSLAQCIGTSVAQLLCFEVG